jgi:hypothetical protein
VPREPGPLGPHPSFERRSASILRAP